MKIRKGAGLLPHSGCAPFTVVPAFYGSLDRVAVYLAGILAAPAVKLI